MRAGRLKPEPEHLGRETVPQPVRCHTGGTAGALGGLS